MTTERFIDRSIADRAQVYPPSIGYVPGFPGRNSDQCSACGRLDLPVQRDMRIRVRRRDDREASGFREDEHLDATFTLCDSCYWAMIAFLEELGTELEVMPLRGYR